jgi:hypothetical protein
MGSSILGIGKDSPRRQNRSAEWACSSIGKVTTSRRGSHLPLA